VKPQPQALRGIISVNVATLFFGLAGVLGKLSGLPAPVITLGRVVFAGVALGALAGLIRVPLRPRSRRDLVLLSVQGLILAIHWTAFFQSIAVSTVAIGLLSYSSFPLFTAALEPLLLGQRPRRIEIVASMLILPGVYLLAPRFSLNDHTTQGILWGLLAGATFALLSVLNRGLTRRYHALTIGLYQDTVAALVLLPTLAFMPTLGGITPRTLFILVMLGVVCTALAHTLFIAGLRDVRAQVASLIAALEPVWGIGFALALLNEIPSGRTLLGGALILLATTLPALSTLHDRSAREPMATGAR
jgi:drug/metabolite transporter (DMT)-like permease